jgi:hypothetical protein
MDTQPTGDWVALCSGCATETGLNDDAHVMEPTHEAIGCAHCGATIVGFFYRVPADAYSGMAPGAG